MRSLTSLSFCLCALLLSLLPHTSHRRGHRTGCCLWIPQGHRHAENIRAWGANWHSPVQSCDMTYCAVQSDALLLFALLFDTMQCHCMHCYTRLSTDPHLICPRILSCTMSYCLNCVMPLLRSMHQRACPVCWIYERYSSAAHVHSVLTAWTLLQS